MDTFAPVPNSFLKWSLIVGIVVVLNLFFNVSLSLIYQEPQYEKFCKTEQVVPRVDKQDECVAAGGQWSEFVPEKRPLPDGSSVFVEGYCNQNFTCEREFRGALGDYNRNVFVTLVVLGVLSVLAGFLTGSFSQALSTALSFGGVLSFIIASIRYWQYAESYIQVIILGAALLALIAIAVKKFRG